MVDVRDIGFGNVGRNTELNLGFNLDRDAPASEFGDGFFQHLGVQLEADRSDITRLFFAQQVAGTPDFQVVGSQAKAAAQIVQLLKHLQTPAGILGQPVLAGDQQVGKGALGGAADPTAQLVQLGQTKLVGPVNNDRVGSRNIKTRLNDRRAQQHIGPVVQEVEHDRFEVALGHLAMANRQAGLGHQRPQLVGHTLNRLHPVMDKKDLSPPLQFTQDGRPDQILVKARHIGPNGLTVDRWRLDHTQVAQSDQAHVEGPGNRRGGQGQHVDQVAQLLDLFLVHHPKAVLFVNHDQAQPFEHNVSLQQPMSADDNIDLAVGQAAHHGSGVLSRTKTVQHLNPHRVAGKAAGKGLAVLLGQNRGRHQYRHLFTTQNAQKRGPQSDLGFSVANIAAHQPVHRLGAVEIGQDIVNGQLLTARFFKRKAGHKLPVLRPINRQDGSLGGLPDRMHLQQLARHGQDGFPGFALDPLPLLGAQTVEGRAAFTAPGVLLDQIDPLNRQVQPISTCVLELQIVALGIGHR